MMGSPPRHCAAAGTRDTAKPFLPKSFDRLAKIARRLQRELRRRVAPSVPPCALRYRCYMAAMTQDQAELPQSTNVRAWAARKSQNDPKPSASALNTTPQSCPMLGSLASIADWEVRSRQAFEPRLCE